MTAVEVSPFPSTSSLIKMEDRKRPSSYENESSMPPLKKHASAVNGSSKSQENEMPWDKDLEVRSNFWGARDIG